MKKEKTRDYAGRLRNSGAQEVAALRRAGGPRRAKAVRGKDLRNGK